MQLYDKSTQMCSKIITENYSTSFSLGIKILNKRLHIPIYSIYSYVRIVDEIVDTFHDFDKLALFDKLESDTFSAINDKISVNPVLHAFQLVVNKYNIDQSYIKAFLKSMRMDLAFETYNDEKYNEYIYGSAEAVGLMCLEVFCENNKEQFEQLQKPAKALGAAFQKVNFLRDIKSDYLERGRVYFPGIDYEKFSLIEKQNIEIDIENDFQQAYLGIIALPADAKLGVLLAYKYYICLFNKIKIAKIETLKNDRIRVPNFQKITLLITTFLGITKK